MLAKDQSPIQQLVSKWWKQPPPRAHEIAACRMALYQAAATEVTRHSELPRPMGYDPQCDTRFKWASQWIAVGESSLYRIQPDIAACAAVHLDPPRVRSGRELAIADDD